MSSKAMPVSQMDTHEFSRIFDNERHSTDPLSVEEYAKLFQGRVNTLILDRGIINA